MAHVGNDAPAKTWRERGTPHYASTGLSWEGWKRYELSNHLGNVLSVVNDRKSYVDEDEDGVADYYEPAILSATDYYPFGMAMAGRTFSTPDYRYGFNGKEKDKGFNGGLTHYDYGFRIYNAGIGKFLSVDPLTADYPWYTPYQFAGNKPIQSIDLDGLEEFEVTGINGSKGTVNGVYADKEQAQSAADNGEATVTYNLPEASVSASSNSSSSSGTGLSLSNKAVETNSAFSSSQAAGGTWASGYNGALRLNYAFQAYSLKSPYYTKTPYHLEDYLRNMRGSLERYKFKGNTRINTLGGSAHLEYIDPNGIKYGTRFYRSNIYVNGAGAIGVAFGAYHAGSVGLTLLTLDTAEDRLNFAMGEGVRSLGAIHQMRLASTSYQGLSIRLGLNAHRTSNIFGSFIYSGLRGAVGSFGVGLYFEGLSNYSRILRDPNTMELWNRNNANNPYSGFVIGAPNYSFWGWLLNSKK